MATYKVLQDIEAEDKLLGPLTMRQFIYAAITLGFGFVAVRLFMTSAWFLGIPFLPPVVFFGLLAAPLGGQQPSEVWLLAKIRFFLKPRKRIWDQSGIKQLVTITVPKKIEKHLTKNFTQDEVTSRLKALASTLDSRGWAIKNVPADMYGRQVPGMGASNPDRLVDFSDSPTPVSDAYVDPASDILDVIANPLAQKMDQMIQQSTQAHREALVASVAQPSNDDTGLGIPQPLVHFDPTTVTPGQSSSTKSHKKRAKTTETDEEKALLDKLHKQKGGPDSVNSHLRTIRPIGDEPTTPPVTPVADPAILELVKNDDFTVATIAQQANRHKEKDLPDDEVVISLR